MERLVLSGLMEPFVAAASDTESTSVAVGIFVFALGIIVGFAGVLVMDYVVRMRARSDYKDWVAAGRPERRREERRTSPPKVE